jgi:hypothetical protein
MKLRPLLLVTASLALLAATGCSTLTGTSCRKPQPYQTAEDLPPLRMPPGLDRPDTSGALKIPALNEPEYPLDPDGPCLEAPPALTEPPPPPSGLVLPERRDRAAPRADPPPGEGAADRQPEEEPSRRRPPRRPR